MCSFLAWLMPTLNKKSSRETRDSLFFLSTTDSAKCTSLFIETSRQRLLHLSNNATQSDHCTHGHALDSSSVCRLHSKLLLLSVVVVVPGCDLVVVVVVVVSVAIQQANGKSWRRWGLSPRKGELPKNDRLEWDLYLKCLSAGISMVMHTESDRQY